MAHALHASEAVDAVYRSDWGRIVATLIRLVRDFDQRFALIDPCRQQPRLDQRADQPQRILRQLGAARRLAHALAVVEAHAHQMRNERIA